MCEEGAEGLCSLTLTLPHQLLPAAAAAAAAAAAIEGAAA